MEASLAKQFLVGLHRPVSCGSIYYKRFLKPRPSFKNFEEVSLPSPCKKWTSARLGWRIAPLQPSASDRALIAFRRNRKIARLWLRRRINFLSHEPGFENLRISYFFRMTLSGQSENILVHDNEIR
jgi:hypothetical protein